jgi:hypothetical protein
VCGLPAADGFVDFGVGSLIRVSTSGGAGEASTGRMLGGSATGRVFFSHHIKESMGRCRLNHALSAASRPSPVEILHWAGTEFNQAVMSDEQARAENRGEFRVSPFSHGSLITLH